MEVPNFINSKPVDEEGNWTPEWANLMNQLLTQLQTNFGPEGIKAPQLTTTQINDLVLIAAMSPENANFSDGSIFFNTTTDDITSMKILINGTLRTFTLT